METVAAVDFSVLLVLLRDVAPGTWVALSADNTMVLATGADVRTVLIEAKRAGEPNPIVLRAPYA